MTLEGMKTLLAGRLGQRTDIDDMIYSEIRQAQRALEKTPPYPWFLLDRNDVDIDITDPTDPYGSRVPDQFIEMADDIVYLLKKTGDTAYYAEPVKVYGAYREHISTMGQDQRGRPKNFILYSQYIEFFPKPDINYTISYFYYRKDNELINPAMENLWSNKAEDLLVAEAGWHVARNIRDNEAATLFGQDRAEARRRIAQETTSRLESMRRAVIGSGEDALLGQHSWEAGHQ